MLVYNIGYAREWQQRMLSLSITPQRDTSEYPDIYYQIPKSQINNTEHSYHAHYLIFRNPRLLTYPVLYRNETYPIYQISTQSI
jgi:hypothetical protein